MRRPFLLLVLADLAFLVAIASAHLVNLNRSSSLEWVNYKRAHGKSYPMAAEDSRRFANFLAAKSRIEAHNSRPELSYKLALNEMSDWTLAELERRLPMSHRHNHFVMAQATDTTRYDKTQEAEEHLNRILSSPVPAPEEVDWRQQPGRVTPVKAQGFCNSHWAFATTGVLEGQQKPTNGSNLVSLSEQNLIDCNQGTNFGCRGGRVAPALDFIKGQGGIMGELDYPYERAQSQVCRFDASKVKMQAKGYFVLEQYNEELLKLYVAKFGPVAVGVVAMPDWLDYHSGVYSSSGCMDFGFNHQLLVVGYGHDARHGDYWLLKNSWGINWGDQGYMKIKRGVNMCNVAMMPVIPLLS